MSDTCRFPDSDDGLLRVNDAVAAVRCGGKREQPCRRACLERRQLCYQRGKVLWVECVHFFKGREVRGHSR